MWNNARQCEKMRTMERKKTKGEHKIKRKNVEISWKK